MIELSEIIACSPSYNTSSEENDPVEENYFLTNFQRLHVLWFNLILLNSYQFYLILFNSYQINFLTNCQRLPVLDPVQLFRWTCRCSHRCCCLAWDQTFNVVVWPGIKHLRVIWLEIKDLNFFWPGIKHLIFFGLRSNIFVVVWLEIKHLIFLAWDQTFLLLF